MQTKTIRGELILLSPEIYVITTESPLWRFYQDRYPRRGDFVRLATWADRPMYNQEGSAYVRVYCLRMERRFIIRPSQLRYKETNHADDD